MIRTLSVARATLLATAAALLATAATADTPVVEAVEATRTGAFWAFDVTLSHPDTGTEHYADAWDIHDLEGNPLGVRILGHPHVTEQPFTRSLPNVEIPEGVTQVVIRGRCNVDGWATEPFTFTLP